MGWACARQVVVGVVGLVVTHAIGLGAVDVPLYSTSYPQSSVAGTTCAAGPFNTQQKIVRMQSVYEASALADAGIIPQTEPITSIGWMMGSAAGTPSPQLNNIRVAYAWLPQNTAFTADGPAIRAWGTQTRTFRYAAGLSVATTTSISASLLPAAGSRHFIDLQNPLFWDGSSHLLLEFSMDNDASYSLDRRCIAFKWAGSSNSNSIFDNARTVFASIFDERCWNQVSYPWSTLTVSPCQTGVGKSMDTSGFTGVVMDIALRTARVQTSSSSMSTITTTTTTASATTSARTSRTHSTTPSLPSNHTGGSTLPSFSTIEPSKKDNDNDSLNVVAIVFAVLFALCSLGLLIVCIQQKQHINELKGTSPKSQTTSITPSTIENSSYLEVSSDAYESPLMESEDAIDSTV